MLDITKKHLLVSIILSLLLTLSACKSTPEYIYVQPECYQVARKTLPQVDAGVLYDVLTLPYRLHPKDVSELLPELPVGFDGHELYYQLVEREKRIVDLLIANETIVKSICKPRGVK
jgi:hypothetical protein